MDTPEASAERTARFIVTLLHVATNGWCNRAVFGFATSWAFHKSVQPLLCTRSTVRRKQPQGESSLLLHEADSWLFVAWRDAQHAVAVEYVTTDQQIGKPSPLISATASAPFGCVFAGFGSERPIAAAIEKQGLWIGSKLIDQNVLNPSQFMSYVKARYQESQSSPESETSGNPIGSDGSARQPGLPVFACVERNARSFFCLHPDRQK